MAHIGGRAETFQRANHPVTQIGLPPGPSEAGRSGARMMVAMPILAQKELHQAEPADVAAGVVAGRDIGLGVADAVDEALGMQGEDQSNRSQPEKRGPAPV